MPLAEVSGPITLPQADALVAGLRTPCSRHARNGPPGNDFLPVRPISSWAFRARQVRRALSGRTSA